MPTVVVTRRSQITLTKEVREKLHVKEGDRVTINTIGRVALIAKQDPTVWDRAGDFLPEDFEKTMTALRVDTTERLRRLGIA
jgi:AbrB family looped-hinge helix DNA binding protein